MRVLDIDLDFFVTEVAHWMPYDGDRLDGNDFPPWNLDDAVAFLEHQCGLKSKLPGIVVENHGELFDRWRDLIDRDALRTPLAVTHVDAHADLGLGDAGYIYLLSTLMHLPLDERRDPQRGTDGLGDGNYLAFAIANRWIDELTYVYNTDDDRPIDLMITVMENFDRNADHIQLEPRTRDEIDLGLKEPLPPRETLQEPRVPFAFVPWKQYRAPAPFDLVCLARSPAFTPQEADAIFDEMRDRFIDGDALA